MTPNWCVTGATDLAGGTHVIGVVQATTGGAPNFVLRHYMILAMLEELAR